LATTSEPPPTIPTPTAPGPTRAQQARRLALRTIAGLAVLFSAMALGAWALQEPLTQAGTWFFNTYGLIGAFVGTVLCDALAIPVPVDTYLAAAVTAGAPALPILAVASAASLLGGALAYLIGTQLHRLPLLQRVLDRYRAQGEDLFARWGITAVVIAAWTPVPFAIVCWLAGTFKMPLRPFFLATLHRIPRIVLYYYVIKMGWLAGT
jgi:membrane protein YqaA with SNARE-associated domain